MSHSLVVLRQEPLRVEQRNVRSTLLRWLAGLFVLGLGLRWLQPVAAWFTVRLLNRLSFTPYLAGTDVASFAQRLLREVRRKRARAELAQSYLQRWLAALLSQALLGPKRQQRTRSRTAAAAPAFAILSPSAACNLRCSHCYAATSSVPRGALSFDGLQRLVGRLEAGGTNLVVLSGGEPLLYRHERNGILQLAASFPELLFVVYTNGTLLDEQVAASLARLGNVLPLISVEGFAGQTDAVRGSGVATAVHRAFENLRRAGVLFGISVTASRSNRGELGSPEFYRHYVDHEGASFVWVLELVAQGRGSFDLELDAADRHSLQTQINSELERGRLIVSFLHTPLAASGCYGAQRFDGFFYMDWEGRVYRCVYQPHASLPGLAQLASGQEVASLLGDAAHMPNCEWANFQTPQRPDRR